jgi:hypothetical protein
MKLSFFETCENVLIEAYKRLGHTLWIDPKGKIIDITGKPLTHFGWLAKKMNIKSANEIYAYAAKNGWIQVRNHSIMTSIGGSISFTGTKKAMKKHRKVIFDIVDETLFDGKTERFLVDFLFTDDNGDVEGERHTFSMPLKDSQLRRFL